MTFKAFNADGTKIWEETTVGETIADPGFFAFRRTAAARDMGDALGKALNLGYKAMLESDSLRSAIEDGDAAR